MADDAPIDPPHWHEQNPWKNTLIYVPIEELAECSLPMYPDKEGNPVPEHDTWTMVAAIAHWTQYGTELDAYILNGGDVLQAGIRYGPEGHHYLSPPFSLPKLRKLLVKYRKRRRVIALSELLKSPDPAG